jgi:predicted RNA methylase
MPVPPIRRRVAVIGCRDDGRLAIALAAANPHDVVAGFDADATAVAAARRAAAEHRVADRVTFEVAAPRRLRGAGYDVVILRIVPAAREAGGEDGSIDPGPVDDFVRCR